MSRADADVVIKLNVHDAEAEASLTAFEARLKRLEASSNKLGGNFDQLTGRIDEMSDSMGNFEKNVQSLDKKSLSSLDKEVRQKDKDFNSLNKTVNKSGKEFEQTGKSVEQMTKNAAKGKQEFEPFEKMFKSIGKFAKMAGMEFVGLSGSIGVLNLALKAGHFLMQAWQVALKGIGVGAGAAVAGLSTVLAAMREYQFAMMAPNLVYSGAKMTGATNARSRVAGFMGASTGMGVFDDKAISAAMGSAMNNGQKVNTNTYSMMRTLGNYAVASGNPDKALPGLMSAFTAAQKNKGKFTTSTFGEIQQASPQAANVFLELYGTQKKLDAALASGKVTVDQFMNAFKEGRLKSVKPFIGALDEVNNTLIGRFKTNLKQVKEQLANIGAPIVEGIKAPFEGVAQNVKILLTKVTPTIQNTLGDMFNAHTGESTIDRIFSRVATMINENFPKIINWGGKIREAVNWTKNLFHNVGNYLKQFTGTGSGLWQNIFKPLGTEVLKTVDHALKTFSKTMKDGEPFAKHFGDTIHQIFEVIRSLIDGLANLKKIMAPILDSFMRLAGIFGGLANNSFVGTIASLGLGGAFMGKGMFKGGKGKGGKGGEEGSGSGFGASGKSGAFGRALGGILGFGSFGFLGGIGEQSNKSRKSGLRSLIQDQYGIGKSKYAQSLINEAQVEAEQMARKDRIANRMSMIRKAYGLQWNSSANAYMPNGAFDAHTFVPGHKNVLTNAEMQLWNVQKDKFGNVSYQVPGSGKTRTIDFDDKRGLNAFMNRAGIPMSTAIAGQGGLSEYGLTRMGAESEAAQTHESRAEFNARVKAEATGPYSEKAARAYGRAQARQFVKDSVKQWAFGTGKELLKQAGPAVAGMALSYAGGIVSKHVAATSNGGQAIAGALSGAGTGAMMGAMFGPAGALAGGLIGGGIGAISGWMNADKAKAKAIEEAKTRAEAYGTSDLIRNNRQSILAQMRKNNSAIAALDKPKIDKLKNQKAVLEQGVQNIFGNNGKWDGGLIPSVTAMFGGGGGNVNIDNAHYRALYRATGMKFNDWWQGTENITGTFKQETTNQKLQQLLRAKGTNGEALITEQERKTIEDYLSKTAELAKVQELGGKSAGENAATQAKLTEKQTELVNMYNRFTDNVGILTTTMGLSEEEASKLAETLNIDLAGSFVNFGDIMKGLGYTTDALANRATAAGRLMDATLVSLEPTKKAIEADTNLNAAGMRLFNTKSGGFSDSNDAKMASVDFANAFMQDMTSQRIDKRGRYFNMTSQQYAAEVQKQMRSYFSSGQADKLDPTALRQLETLFFGDTGFNGRLAPKSDAGGRRGTYGTKTTGGVYDIVGKSTTSLDNLLKYDEQFATGMQDSLQAAGKAATTAYMNTPTDQRLTPKQYAEQQLNAVLNSPAFKNSGLDSKDTKVRESLKGLILGEMDQGVLGMTEAFKSGAKDLADALKNTTLGIAGTMTGTIDSHTGVVALNISPSFTQGSDLNPQASGAKKAGDTATSRFGRTIGAHRQFDSMLPGKRTVTSGVRNWGLGSPSSDHLTGRAFDLTGDNLGQYSQMVNNSGGFAEFHGAGGSRHLHVVPPVGDTMNPAALGGAAAGVVQYNISIPVQTDADPEQIAQTVIREIKRTQRSDMERR